MDLEQVLEKVKLRPRMYITWDSIYSLGTFMDGYGTALYENFGNTHDDAQLSFGHWVEYKYEINNSFWSWERVLHHIAGSEGEALDLFFELWPQYLEERDTFKTSKRRLSFGYPKESVTNETWKKFFANRNRSHNK